MPATTAVTATISGEAADKYAAFWDAAEFGSEFRRYAFAASFVSRSCRIHMASC